MKIERIDDKTVKCFLSNEELEEYDIDYKDFVTRSDKAKEVVQEIIEQVIVGGNVEQVFEDCVRTWKDNLLAKEEQRLILLISMADEEDNQERIAELTDQLIKVQKKRKSSSRGI